MTPSSLIDCLDGCLDGCLGDCLGGLGARRQWMGRSERTAALRGGLLILSAGATTGCAPRFPGNARDVVIVSAHNHQSRVVVTLATGRSYLSQRCRHTGSSRSWGTGRCHGLFRCRRGGIMVVRGRRLSQPQRTLHTHNQSHTVVRAAVLALRSLQGAYLGHSVLAGEVHTVPGRRGRQRHREAGSWWRRTLAALHVTSSPRARLRKAQHMSSLQSSPSTLPSMLPT